MNTKSLLEDYVQSKTNYETNFPKAVMTGINTIPGDIPFKLKLAITLSELITFSSHLRKPIRLYDDTLVPTNAIVFALSASGTSKDKSLSTLRKSLSSAYEALELQRRHYAQEKAKNTAILEGETKENWQKYYCPPKPLQTGLGTVEGLTQHFSDISANPIGAGSISSSEIGSELQNNGAMTDIIKTISVAYDLGNIPPKIVKSHENQTDFIKGFPVNALFFGSQEAILFNNEIKNKFRLVFNTQLARRSIFSFTPEDPILLKINSIDELYEKREKERKSVLNSQKELNELTLKLVEEIDHTPLELSPEANKLFDVYLELNSILSNEMSNKYPISKLSRKHKQWLALKLAGSYAIIDNDNMITEKHYAQAINTVEYLCEDLTNFEKELVKEPYEQLVDMCKFQAEDEEFYITLHELRKMSYITGTTSSKNRLEELCTLANSYDEQGTYTCTDNGIHYKELVKTDTVGVSYIIFDDTYKDEEMKNHMMSKCATGFDFYETDFSEIEMLLQENAAYSSFAFTEGVRKKSNVCSGTKFVALDIDKSKLTDKEAHVILNQYNHYVVRTSNPDDEFKFRVILELDAVVDLEHSVWKHFLNELGKELGLVVDLLPKSQVYFCYSGREILKQLSGETIKTKVLIDRAIEASKTSSKPTASLPKSTKDAKLNDPRSTFAFAFEAENGNGSQLIYRALVYAYDLGADADYIENLAKEINSYWSDPMPEERLYTTLITPMLRRF